MSDRVELSRVPGLPLDWSALQARVQQVLDAGPYWFPVRHHSPTVALHVGAAIRARRPRLVLIEGPSEASHLIAHLLDRKTRPPVAIYSSYRDDANVLGLAGVATPSPDVPVRSSVWYPLLPYSPELEAMLAAQEVGAELAFIDLPHHALMKPHRPPENDEPEPRVEAVAPSESAGEATHERGSEGHIERSEFYQRLAAAAGFRTFDEAWDGLFEVGGQARDTEDFRRDMACFCAAARATTDPARIASDDTLPRERFMLREIRRHLSERELAPEQAVVVTGGFHMLLDRDDPELPPEPPPGTLNTTIVPYSYYRVAERSGYAAGNRAPAFYQLQWDTRQRGGDHQDLVIEHVTRVMRQGRKKGSALSSADAIAVTQHASMLGRLRGRSEPVLDDIEDALITCCCKGDPAEVGQDLQAAMREAAVGSRVGKVTRAVGMLPIVADFQAQISDLELGEALQRDRNFVLSLDRKQPLDARRSAFLHRLCYLGVPLGSLDPEAVRGTIHRETWTLRWSPSIDPAVVERSALGDTIESAAAAKLEEDLAHAQLSAGATTARVLDALRMELPDFATRLHDVCGPAIDADPRFVSLAHGLTSLLVIDRHAAFRGLRRDVVADLVVRCYGRASFAIPDIASVPPEEEREAVDGLQAVAEAVLGEHEVALDRDLFAAYVSSAAAQTSSMFMRGVLLGLLAELRVIDGAVLAAEISGLARGAETAMVAAGDLVRGILEVSRASLMLGADAIVEAIDELLRASSWEIFLVMLPSLRAAFEKLRGADLGVMCDRVAVRYGLREVEELDLSLTVGAAALMAEVDQRVAQIMEGFMQGFSEGR
ncbi:DUF5682 family protein [Paraliomyxa miuraensis]|uniref:DUF5682 family protein n=1 Tax=Paraliomyxa miuraensis TaxID=376150 RepID=UPI002253A867|nr:DUF5682 family protein [Paraliomyxa miuraensis]MCX4247671.1 DUF5682 family protein [Paraliomyxa miuraensis]